MAWGTITLAQRHRRLGRAGNLEIKIVEVRLTDGERIPLRAVREARGSGRAAIITGAMIATGLFFFPAAPLFLFIRGKDITLPKGMELTAYIDGNTEMDEGKFLKSSQISDLSSATTAPQAHDEVEGNSPK